MTTTATIESLPGYAEFQRTKESLTSKCGELPMTDLKQRLRSVGSLTVDLEDPSEAVLADPNASPDAKRLAAKVLNAAQKVSGEVANLIVDIGATKDTIVDGRQAVFA